MSRIKDEKGKLPSVRAKELADDKKRRDEARAAGESLLRDTIVRLSNTRDGQVFMRWLMKECGWGESYLGINPTTGAIDPDRTVYQAMRLNLYRSVRKYIPVKKLMEIEHE